MKPKHLALGRPARRRVVHANMAGKYPPGYNARKNATEIAQISDRIAAMTTNASSLPGWAEDYLAVARSNLDQVASYLEYEQAGEGVAGQFGGLPGSGDARCYEGGCGCGGRCRGNCGSNCPCKAGPQRGRHVGPRPRGVPKYYFYWHKYHPNY